MRPDSLLVVIFVTDENDCSAPVDNRGDSTRVICRYNIVDNNSDGVPDGYNDPDLCASGSPEQCFRDECGALPAEECFNRRCRVNFGDYMRDRDVYFACEYEQEDLTDVRDYFRFLTGLRAQPREQLVVASIAGPNQITEAGSPVFYVGSNVAPMCVEPLNCVPDVADPSEDPDCILESTVSYINEDCCPNGNCQGGGACFMRIGEWGCL